VPPAVSEFRNGPAPGKGRPVRLRGIPGGTRRASRSHGCPRIPPPPDLRSTAATIEAKLSSMRIRRLPPWPLTKQLRYVIHGRPRSRQRRPRRSSTPTSASRWAGVARRPVRRVVLLFQRRRARSLPRLGHLGRMAMGQVGAALAWRTIRRSLGTVGLLSNRLLPRRHCRRGRGDRAARLQPWPRRRLPHERSRRVGVVAPTGLATARSRSGRGTKGGPGSQNAHARGVRR
jgi:hypothetical protein